MIILIVALDGPRNQFELASALVDEGVGWFKIGPLLMSQRDWAAFSVRPRWFSDGVRIFLDLKLADTNDTVSEAVKRFAEADIAAVSTCTPQATSAAVRAAEGTNLKVWELLVPSDGDALSPRLPLLGVHGVILPAVFATLPIFGGLDRITPGVRLPQSAAHGHRYVSTPEECLASGVTHAVVGRPIWQADDPARAARQYIAALRDQSENH